MKHGLTASEPSPQVSTTAAERAQTVSLIEQLFPQPRTFNVRLADGTVVPGSGDPRFSLQLTHPGALRRTLALPIELSMAEAYIYGDFDIAGDIFAIFSPIDELPNRKFTLRDVVDLVRSIRALPKSGPSRPLSRGPARLGGRLHSRERDLAAVRYHYDVGNDFFELWLDRRLQYSCAYFPTGNEDLDTAQERKLEHICRKLRLKPGERLLDIGCGWGGLAVYAAENYSVEVLGVTLSDSQARYAQARQTAGVTVQLLDYRDVESGAFDKIVSVGMFEHVGRSQLPAYFGHAYRMLKPGGLFLNHGISSRPSSAPGAKASRWRRFITRRIVGDGLFAQRYVFPDGQLVPVSEANLVAEHAGLEVRDVENLSEHYALTLRQWVDRLEGRQEDAIRMTDETTFRTWRLYMAAAAYGFEAGRIGVNQTLLSKPPKGDTRTSSVPLTRADLYER
jgi:cyclopropane-fatty-acyl-phospholipid synthase